MAYNSYSFVPQQPLQQTQAPIDFGSLGFLGQVAEKRKDANLAELDQPIKVNTIPGSADRAYVQKKNQELSDLTNQAISIPGFGTDPVVTRDIVRKARQIRMDPAFQGFESEYSKWVTGEKRLQEAGQKENATSEGFQNPYKSSLQDYINSGGFLAGKSVKGHDFEFGTDVDKELQVVFEDLKSSGSESARKLRDIDEQYYKTGWEGVDWNRVKGTAKEALDLIKQRTVGRQLEAEYDMRKQRGELPVSRKDGQVISKDQYILDKALEVGHRFVWGKSESNEADIKNAAVAGRTTKRAQVTTEPLISTASTGFDMPWTDMSSFDEYSNSILPGLVKTKEAEIAEAKAGGAPSEVIKKLERERAELDSQIRNTNQAYFAVSKMPGNIEDNFKKYAESTFKKSEQTIPRGKGGDDYITDRAGNTRKTAAKVIEERGVLLSRANDIKLTGEDGEPLDPEKNIESLKEGDLKLRALSFGKDGNPVLKVSIMVNKNGTEPATEKMYTVENVPEDILLKLADDHNTLSDNYKFASEVATPEQAAADLQNVKDHQQAAINIRHAAVNSYVNRTVAEVPDVQGTVTFDLEALDIPGKKIIASKDGDKYTVEGVGTFASRQGLINWISKNVDYYKSQK